jgi:hypothetical protein
MAPRHEQIVRQAYKIAEDMAWPLALRATHLGPLNMPGGTPT